MTKNVLVIALYLSGIVAAAPCGSFAVNPVTRVLDCVGVGGSGTGTVTTFSGSGPSWLTWTVTNPTTTPSVSLAPTTGQTPHQVIGTCNAGTTFAPCNLVLGDLPTQGADTVVMNSTGSSASPTATAMPTCTSGADLYNTSTHTWSCVSTGGGFIYSQGPNSSATTMTGSDVTIFTASSVPALSAGACWDIKFTIKAGTAGGASYKLYVDATAVSTIASTGGTAWKQVQFLYCNNAGVQNAQTITEYINAYCIDGSCATGTTGWTSDFPQGITPTITNSVNLATSHTITITGSAPSGNLTGQAFRMGL